MKLKWKPYEESLYIAHGTIGKFQIGRNEKGKFTVGIRAKGSGLFLVVARTDTLGEAKKFSQSFENNSEYVDI